MRRARMAHVSPKGRVAAFVVVAVLLMMLLWLLRQPWAGSEPAEVPPGVPASLVVRPSTKGVFTDEMHILLFVPSAPTPGGAHQRASIRGSWWASCRQSTQFTCFFFVPSKGASTQSALEAEQERHQDLFLERSVGTAPSHVGPSVPLWKRSTHDIGAIKAMIGVASRMQAHSRRSGSAGYSHMVLVDEHTFVNVDRLLLALASYRSSMPLIYWGLPVTGQLSGGGEFAAMNSLGYALSLPVVEALHAMEESVGLRAEGLVGDMALGLWVHPLRVGFALGTDEIAAPASREALLSACQSEKFAMVQAFRHAQGMLSCWDGQ